MPAEIPLWWLLLSGLFFVVNIVFFAVLSFVAWKLLGLSHKVEPKIESLLATVNGIGHKVDDLTAIVKDVAARVGQQAEGVSASANQISHVAAQQVEKFGPIIAAATAAYKVIGTARQLFLDGGAPA
ncbi:hypothetical protein EON77_09265, partial [bacterium]